MPPLEARLYLGPGRHGRAWASCHPEQGPLFRPSPSCPGGWPGPAWSGAAEGRAHFRGSGCQKEPGCPLRRKAKGWESPEGEGPMGAALCAPSVGPGRRGTAQTLLPSPVAHLCPPCPVLPAELTPPALPLLWHQLPSHQHFHPVAREGLAFWGWCGEARAAQLHF